MKAVLSRLEARSLELRECEFFARLRPEPDLGRALAFAPSLAFFVFGFQDAIRLNAESARDPEIRDFLLRHVAEDRGHERWFLDDVRAASTDVALDPTWMFAERSWGVRKAAWAITAEVHRHDDDRLRIVWVEALEAAAHVMFAPVVAMLATSGHASKLHYFGGKHLEAEASHEMFTEHASFDPLAIELDEASRSEADALVDRVLQGFEDMLSALPGAMASRSERPGAPTQLTRRSAPPSASTRPPRHP